MNSLNKAVIASSFLAISSASANNIDDFKNQVNLVILDEPDYWDIQITTSINSLPQWTECKIWENWEKYYIITGQNKKVSTEWFFVISEIDKQKLIDGQNCIVTDENRQIQL